MEKSCCNEALLLGARHLFHLGLVLFARPNRSSACACFTTGFVRNEKATKRESPKRKTELFNKTVMQYCNNLASAVCPAREVVVAILSSTVRRHIWMFSAPCATNPHFFVLPDWELEMLSVCCLLFHSSRPCICAVPTPFCHYPPANLYPLQPGITVSCCFEVGWSSRP